MEHLVDSLIILGIMAGLFFGAAAIAAIVDNSKRTN